MRSHLKTTLIAAAIAVACSGAATAQLAVDEHLRGMLEAPLSPNEVLVGGAQLAELEEGDRREFVFQIDPDEEYTIYGGCDDDCSNIDLVAQSGNGELIDQDVEDDDEPLVLILAGESGDEVRVTLSLESCETDTCIVGVAMFRSR